MRALKILLCAVAVGLGACSPEDASGNGMQAGNEAANANIAGGMESGGAPATTNADAAAAQTTRRARRGAFRGCPIRSQLGSGCITVTSNGVTYELYSAGPLPDPSQRLIVEGTGMTGGISTCMVGMPLTDVEWQYTKAKCDEKE